MTAAFSPRIISTSTANIPVLAAERMLSRMSYNSGAIAICLTGGSSPGKLYQLLATAPYAKRIPWDRVHWFIGDERFVPEGDELHNMTAARRAFLDQNAPPDHIHSIPTTIGTPDDAAKSYAATLQAFSREHRAGNAPLFDMVLLGIGPDGHIGSLFPGFPETAEREKWVVGVPHANVPPFVPRISLTLPKLCDTDEILIQLSGEGKRSMTERLLGGEDLPASHAIARGETVWICDPSALPEPASD